ncbi:MAG: ornithine cyclodeaminase family protein [Bauldia sp.]|nr:ornithine cyclodeaminase family protein [Bauldia sp.]
MAGVTIVPDALCSSLVDEETAFRAVSDVFAAMSNGEARNFPVVREALGYEDALYGFKGGFDRAGQTLGVKAGGYWPNNHTRGLINHQSSVLLFDPDTGRISAMVGGNYLTAVRTAAASAVSIAQLARPDVKVLGIVGAGHQSAFQLRGAVRQRKFERIIGWNFHPEMLPRVAETAKELGLPFEAVELGRLAAEADVIITITSSFAPILLAQHVRPGTHIACMGTDTRGKQEVAAEYLAAATVFTDERAQSVAIGEAQHAVAAGLVAADAITEIGDVITGRHPGRTSAEEITLFDGTGVGLQDLAVARVAVQVAKEKGTAIEVSY